MQSATQKIPGIMILMGASLSVNLEIPSINGFMKLLEQKLDNCGYDGELPVFNVGDESNQVKESLEKHLSLNETRLCIVISYSFSSRAISRLLGEAIDGGLRVLVIDNDIDYKKLAGHFGVFDIKHKARIERMDFDSWDEPQLNLMSGIIEDELRRIIG